ncbi:hypothetical protein Y032_0257g403 [Ancylostoma ceylanicum]|uniref:Uncharacterized protein n=1 Tax=Ancylostoma ceylanicum TaxID=53326 RepID=A0A016SAX3_9BILA|nr:hypothetical protein Y032_0257g403 [Ancylostoma ceylanicum]
MVSLFSLKKDWVYDVAPFRYEILYNQRFNPSKEGNPAISPAFPSSFAVLFPGYSDYGRFQRQKMKYIFVQVYFLIKGTINGHVLSKLPFAECSCRPRRPSANSRKHQLNRELRCLWLRVVTPANSAGKE